MGSNLRSDAKERHGTPLVTTFPRSPMKPTLLLVLPVRMQQEWITRRESKEELCLLIRPLTDKPYGTR